MRSRQRFFSVFMIIALAAQTVPLAALAQEADQQPSAGVDDSAGVVVGDNTATTNDEDAAPEVVAAVIISEEEAGTTDEQRTGASEESVNDAAESDAVSSDNETTELVAEDVETEEAQEGAADGADVVANIDDQGTVGAPTVELPSTIPTNATSAPRRDLLEKLKDAQQGDATTQSEPYVPGEVLVRFKTKTVDLTTTAGKTFADQFADAQRLDRKSVIAASNIAVYKTRDGETTTDAVARLHWIPGVLHAQPNFVYQPRTNDTLFSALWALENTGQIVNNLASTTPDHDIDAPEAWTKSEGDGVIVAVIDSGVAFNHPDLLANMWDGTNCTGVDLDDAPIVGGCEHGFDFDDNDLVPLPTTSSHGTHIAGTIGAVGSNGAGIVGVAPRAQVMALRAQLTLDGIISAINFAKVNGATAINASWGTYGDGSSMSDIALKEAIEDFPGLFIVAAGNEAFDHDDGDPAHVSYPDGFDVDNILVVSATNQDDELASFSDYGAESVDVGAPGTNILSTTSSISTEDFAGGIPSGFIANGGWGVSGGVLRSDTNSPYAANANSTVTSPVIDLSDMQTKTAGITMITACDTELDSDFWTDYVALEVSGDGWTTSTALGLWDEVSLGGLADGGAGMSPAAEMAFVIDPALRTNAFQYRLRWVTNGTDSGDGLGCVIDDIEIIGDGSKEQYEYKKGTSMAAPHVAGVAALVKGFNKNATTAQIKEIVMETGDALTSLAGKTVSGKRVNAANALNVFAPHVGLTEDDKLMAGGHSLEGEVIKFNFRVKDGIAGLPFTLKEFGYSTDGGTTWSVPTHGDASDAIGSFLLDERTTVADFTDDDAYVLMFNTNHADLTGLRGDDQDDVMIRFKANDGAVDSAFAVSAAFSVDLRAPTATLSGTPDALTAATGATFTVSGDDAVSYQYSLDGAAFSPATPVAEPIMITGLTDGSHTLRVIAIDDVGNAQVIADATTVTWTVDTTPGTALLTSKPDVRTNETSATFVVGGEDVVTYTYQLDGGEVQGPFSADETIALADLAEGPHTISVAGIDALENVQEEPTTYNWVIDTSAAAPTISGAPDALTNQTSATLTIGGEDVVAYRFALDGGAFEDEAPVAAPIELTNLTDGTHTVAVIGRDDVGNWQAEVNATTVSWTVDTIAPTLAEVESVATPTNDTTPSLTVQVEADAMWEVLRGETVLASDMGTGEAQTVQLATLTDGIYTLTLTATDAAGNTGSVALSEFVVDTTSPTGLSLSGVPDALTNATSATITVVAGNDLVAYRSAFDASDFGAETPVATPVTLNDLENGAHTLRVIGKDAAGNWMPEGIAATATWTVDTVPPTAALSGLPFAETPATTATITVGGKDVVAYRAALDNGTFSNETPVAEPLALINLSDATHTLAVIGRDAAGNWQSEDEATTFTWLVDRSLAVPPTANPVSGTLTAPQLVRFTAPLAESMHYTYGEPGSLSCATGSSMDVTGDLLIDRTTTVHVVACYAGGVPSEVQTFVYTLTSRGGNGGGGGSGGSAGTVYNVPASVTPRSIDATPAATLTTPNAQTSSTVLSGQVLGARSFADGVLLRVNERDIYLVDGGQLHKVPNVQALWRYRHHERLDVSNTAILGYTVGDSVLTMRRDALRVLGSRTFVNGALLRINGGTIYLIDDGKLRKIPTIGALWAYRDRERFEVNTDVLEAYTLGVPVA
ncbi:MAG: S8 family serine peptidase [bacterium]|nr:S8 family serine peptidase [bacterium]